jgi:hypothetical protein
MPEHRDDIEEEWKRQRYEFQERLKSLDLDRLESARNVLIDKRRDLEDTIVKLIRGDDVDIAVGGFLQFVTEKRKIVDNVVDITNRMVELQGGIEAVRNNENINRDLEVSNAKVLHLRLKTKYPDIPEKHALLSLADKCRKKNGKINFSKLGDEIGRSNHTAKEWCKHHKIE